jgi:amino acid adenylation domain-containing protein
MEDGGEGQSRTSEPPSEIEPPDTTANDIAYLLYTSGSTGAPKAVLQTHGNVLRHIDTYGRALGITAGDRLSLLSTYSFDAAVMDLYGALLHGATLCPFDLRSAAAGALAGWLGESGITIYHSTPTVYRHLLADMQGGEDFSCVRRVVLGGEEVLRRDFERFRERFSPGTVLVNGLGPTESTLALQCFLDHGAEPARSSVPAGHPVAGTEVRLWHPGGEQAALYGTGEIVIESPAIALGYWRRPDLTAAAFTPSPHGDGARVYRTGDLGRLLPDGAIEFAGRKDLQVKIRGHRVELGEVEAALRELPGVREAAAAVRPAATGDLQLVAWLVPEPGAELPSAGELGEALARRLPDLMVPRSFVILEALPLTTTGKVDRRSLPDPAPPPAETAGAAPRTPVEELLLGIWTEVLGVEPAGVHDDFFALGGHSLIATRIVARIEQALRIELPLRTLFEKPTVASLAPAVEQARWRQAGPALPPLVRVPRDGPLPLSFAQHRYWARHQAQGETAAFNLAVAARFTGTLDIAALMRTLRLLAARHETFRTTFTEVNGEAVQVIHPEARVELPLADLSRLEASEAAATETQRLALALAGHSFDLARGPLFRLLLVRLGAREHALLAVRHHLTTDGWSTALFAQELAALYRAVVAGQPPSLPELPVQYADFAVWQRRVVAESGLLAGQKAYWKRKLAGLASGRPLELPADRPRTSRTDAPAARLSRPLGAGLTNDLRELGRRHGATLFMTLLAGFKLLLRSWTGDDDLCVTTDVANRTRVETERLLGLFTNVLALRTDLGNLGGAADFRTVLARVRETTLEAYAHQDLPFAEMLAEVAPGALGSYHRLFPVVFVLQNFPRQSLELPGVSLRTMAIGAPVAQRELILVLTETPDGLIASCTYRADLFEPATVAGLLERYEDLLTAAAEDPGIRLAQLVAGEPREDVA